MSSTVVRRRIRTREVKRSRFHTDSAVLPGGAKQNFAERSERMNRTYEVMYIVRPDVEEADLDKLIEASKRTLPMVADR